MKKAVKKKFEPNEKITSIICISCRKPHITNRSHAKYCSHLCCVHDGLDKKEKGYTFRVFIGTEKDLIVWRDVFSIALIKERFKYDFLEIEKALKVNERSFSWKLEGKDYRLSYFPNIKSKTYELYYTKEKAKFFQDADKRAS